MCFKTLNLITQIHPPFILRSKQNWRSVGTSHKFHIQTFSTSSHKYNNLSFRKARLAYLLPKLKMREWTQWPTAPPMRDADLNSKMVNTNLLNLKLSDKDHIQNQQDVKHVFTQVY